MSRFRLLLTGLTAFVLSLCLGCGGGPPRKPTPPRSTATANKREKFVILGAGDNWHEPLPIIDGLKRLGGVLDVSVDQTDGKYVVVYNPQRTHRDAIRQRLLEIGQELQRDPWEPLFDER